MIEIDGSYGEGGGELVRTALALSTITQKPFKVNNIRAGRPNPGLKAQHLYCIKALKQLCNAQTNEVDVGSTELEYNPGKIQGKTITINIGTAGSITLLLQSILIPSLFSDTKVRLKITGGTDTKWSMPFDYFNELLIPHIRKYCESVEVKLEKRGYYPKGNGKVDIVIKPKKEKTIRVNLIEQGKLIQVKGVSHASLDLQKANVAERQAKAAKLGLSKLNVPVNIRSEYQDTLSTGSGITLWAIFSEGEEIDLNNPVRLGADILGERGKRAEKVGQEAAEKLIKEINSTGAVDSHLCDNLIPLMALFNGKIKTSEITEHTKTNIWITEQFLDVTFKISGNTIESAHNKSTKLLNK